jgi:phage shock protein C
MLAGVAGGLAEMWDADPSLVRIIWALLVVFTGGIALVVYIVMAIVVPEDDEEYLQPAPASYGPTAAPASAAAVADPASAAGAPGPAVTPDPGSAPGQQVGAAASAAVPPPTYWTPGTAPTRADARAARRAARRASRHRGDSGAPVVIGVFLVLFGGFFLARQWLPELDWNWFWPAMLIGLGVLVLLLALGRRQDDHGDRS